MEGVSQAWFCETAPPGIHTYQFDSLARSGAGELPRLGKLFWGGDEEEEEDEEEEDEEEGREGRGGDGQAWVLYPQLPK